MKIGILTFHFAHNYGAVLQAYALQEKLISMGHEVMFINYQPVSVTNRYKIFYRASLKYDGIGKNLKVFFHSLLCLRRRIKRYRGFSIFINKELKVSGRKFKSKINGPLFGYDAYVFGSDQIWNFRSRGFDENYYGEFTTSNNAIKIGYGNSIEGAEYTTEAIKKLTYYLKNFNAISVREPNLIKILQPLTSTPIQSVLDPTLIITKDTFDNIAVTPNLKKKYVLMYQVIPLDGLYEFTQKIAKQLGAEVIKLNPNVPTYKKDAGDKSTASPYEFIGYFKHAECVVTTSFHGTAFSIIYNKPFYAVPVEPYSSRIINLLTKLKLNDRIVKITDTIRFTGINYIKSNQLLDMLKSESENFLLTSLKIS